MNTRLLSLLTIIASLSMGPVALAGTVGALNWDGASSYITDSANSERAYIQLGLYKTYKYVDLLDAIDTDPILDGYRIATAKDAVSFYNSISGSSIRYTTPWSSAEVAGVTDGIFGSNYDSVSDYAWFLTGGTDTNSVGYIALSSEDIGYSIGYERAYFNIEEVDVSNTISWLLVTDTYEVSAVPIPAALFMFAPALLGFLGFRRKRQA
ncbi:MAG: hypothetical protein AB1Y22_07205 [Cycloclasticus sp.]